MRISSFFIILATLGLGYGFLWGEDAKDQPKELSLRIIAPSLADGAMRSEGKLIARLTNATDHDIVIFQEWCSWGYFNLTFEWTGADGSRVNTKKKARGWGKNFPATHILATGASFDIPVDFASGDWEKTPMPTEGNETKVAILGIYSNEDEEAVNEAWTGRIKSEPVEVTFKNP